MNAPAVVEFERPPQRWRLTLDDVLRMMEVGILPPDARVELLDGELIEMPAEGGPHVRYKTELTRFFVLNLPDDLRVATDSTLRLAAEDAPDPDLYVYPASVREEELTAADVLLVVEIADSSLGLDLGRKASKYASYGIVEYWVVDVNARLTHVLSDPDAGAYRDIRPVPLDQPLTPLRLPQLRLVISDLPRLG